MRHKLGFILIIKITERTEEGREVMIELLGKSQQYLEDSCLFNSLTGVESTVMDERLYLNFPEHGIQFLVDTELDSVERIFLRQEGEKYLEQDSAFVPLINFTMSRAQVRNILGVPISENDPEAMSILGPIKPWDKYSLNVNLHIQYSESQERVETLTLSELAQP